MPYIEKGDLVEKSYYKPSEAAKILGVSQAYFSILRAEWGFKSNSRYTQKDIYYMAKMRELRALLKKRPYSFDSKRIINKIWETKTP